MNTQGKIVIVGCGFLGSIFTDELLRRLFAATFDNTLVFVDGDTWERRNAANQNVALVDASKPGTSKAFTLAARAETFERTADAINRRITSTNELQEAIGPDVSLIVDAVDNLATRHLMYEYGIRQNAPVLHIGLSLAGSGAIEWSDKYHNTFSLSPWKVKPGTKDPESSSMPPCELIQLRGAGLNTAFIGAVAASIYLGFDPEEHVGKDSLGWLTTWRASNTGYAPVKPLWAKREDLA